MPTKIELDMVILEKLTKALKKGIPSSKVGVLGDHNIRTDAESAAKGLGNADVGLVHEFGVGGYPRRSFLRMPLMEKLGEYLLKSKEYEDEKLLKDAIETGNMYSWAKSIAKVAEKCISDAFGSAGFGKWAMWRGGYRSKTGAVLLDTTQLQKSISSEIVK